MAAQLPPELLRRIIDFAIWDSKWVGAYTQNCQVLLAGALVCRHWHSVFKEALWRRMSIQGDSLIIGEPAYEDYGDGVTCEVCEERREQANGRLILARDKDLQAIRNSFAACPLNF